MAEHPVVGQFGGIMADFNYNRCRPRSVQINLTNVCPSNCKSCGKKTWPQIKLDHKVVLSLISQLSDMGCQSIVLSGGEPFSYGKNIVEVIKFIQLKGMKVGILTSGIIAPGVYEAALEVLSGVEWIKFSVDAADAKIFNEVRGINAFDSVIERIKDLRERFHHLKIRNNATISSLNYTQIYPLIELGRDLEIETHFFPVHTHEELLLTKKELEAIRDLHPKIHRNSLVKYVYEKTNFWNFLDLCYRKKPAICCIPFSHLMIDADGSIFYCCRTMNDNDVYENRDLKYCTGNIYNGRLKYILDSQASKILRMGLRDANEPMCKFCDRYNHVNKLFAEWVQDPDRNKPLFL